MNADLEKLVSQIKQLPLEELLTLQERIIAEVQSKIARLKPSADAQDKTRPVLGGLKMLNMDHWPPDSTYRREDIYGDEMR